MEFSRPKRCTFPETKSVQGHVGKMEVEVEHGVLQDVLSLQMAYFPLP